MRERISNLIDIANEREIPLTDVQSVHRSVKNSLSARNFDKLKGKLHTEFDVEKLALLEERLNHLVMSHIQFDDKAILFVTDLNISELETQLEDFFTHDDSSIELNYSKFAKIDLEGDKILYQFCITKEISLRQKLSPNDLNDNIADDYQEVIGIKKIPIICHDFILLDHKADRAIVGVDLAMVLGANDLNISKINFLNFIKRQFGISLIDRTINLFPKIEEFYNLPFDKLNGVIEIYFLTPAGTAHHEILKSGSVDIRTSQYHNSGVKGVRNEQSDGQPLNNDITPYRITTRFYSKDSNTKDIDISLKSNYQAIHTEGGSQLFDAQIYGTRNINDLNFVIEKLIG
ncbi:hypothetical protein HG532_02595 [Moraxella osloensis]|nr:hypothetical protein [Moraxella osloensis]MBW4008915.1 hypothetical protein [Moraxella osloensis]